MKIVVYTNAGVFSQTLVYLSWCIFKEKEDKCYYYYYNKYTAHNDPIISKVNEQDNLIYAFIEKNNLIEEEFVNADILTNMWPPMCKKYPEYFTTNLETCGNLSQNVSIFKSQHFSFYRNLYNTAIQKNFCLKSSFLEKITQRNSHFFSLKGQGKKILSVMLRLPLHYHRGELNFDFILNQIHSIMKEYDYILPITIVHEYYQKILEHFGDKVIKLDRYRSKKLSDDWYHKYNKGDSLVNEVEYAIEDVYLSSQCNHVLGSSSNLFLMTLFMNKDMSYDLIHEVASINGS